MENFDLEKFKDYVNTYDQQMGHKKYSVKTIIDDFLYGIGLCLDEDEYYSATGYAKFKKVLLEHLNAVPASEVPKKCYCGEPVDTENPDCVAFNLCKDHASDS
jgi:hypothetical protein